MSKQQSSAGSCSPEATAGCQSTESVFKPRLTIEQVEEGRELAPKFDRAGLIPCVTTDYASGELLMHGYMNEEALRKTIELGQAVYYSRSRQALWHKGATSGLVQQVREMRIDDDQDCVWLRVEVAGGGCHVGYRSCFYRRVPVGEERQQGEQLSFTEDLVFDPHRSTATPPIQLSCRKIGALATPRPARRRSSARSNRASP